MAVIDAVLVRVPDENEFDEDEAYLGASDLDDLLSELVGKYQALGIIEQHGIRVQCLWKKKGGVSKGVPTLGRTQIPGGLLAHYCRADAVIWLAADHVKGRDWTTDQVRKQLYHQARYIGWEDGKEDADGEQGDGRIVLQAPQLALFAGEVRDTGLWEGIRNRAASDFSQPGLGL